LFAIGLLGLASCSKQPLTDPGVPESCTVALPHRCDVCSTGETICAHYVVRNGTCVVETCPPPNPTRPDASLPPDTIVDASVPVPDASVPVTDAIADSSAVTPVGPSYDCGPADAGLRCSCGLETYFPAPVNDAGQQQTFVLPPDPATVVAYTTMAEFDALAVGRWQRTAGMAEVVCEQFGLEFTADHRMIPLVIASDGSVQAVTAQARSFTIGGNHLLMPGLTTNAPIFFDAGRSMYFLFSPWPANYVRAD
jgi:hypothetical protein